LRFSQSWCGNSEWKQESYNIEKSGQDLESIIDFCQKNFQDKKINIIAHSLWTYIVSNLDLKLFPINKIIFTWILSDNTALILDKITKRILKSWWNIDKSWVSIYPRSNWNINRIWKSFWKKFEEINVLENLKNFKNIFLIKPLQDEIVWNDREFFSWYWNLKNIKYFELNWDHNFSNAKDRIKLISLIKNILN